MDDEPNLFVELVDRLKQPSSYGADVQCVEFHETHISCVFLAGKFAYKLKKPVKFEFADFSRCEARYQACQAEVRLNRRLTADVYHGVVPVLRDKRGRFRLAGDGQLVDWLVKMRRLNSADTLLEGIKAGHVSDANIESVVSLLDDFYHVAIRPEIDAQTYHQDFLHHIRANQSALIAIQGLPKALIRRVHQRQLRSLAFDRELLRKRVLKGAIVDGHGDLRPEHIFLERRTQIIDCIEFSDEYRRLDVADEICFLGMECDRLGAAWLGNEFVKRCEQKLHDHWPPRLVAFYQAYRACVRAKTAALRAVQLSHQAQPSSLTDVIDYLQLADRYTGCMGKPMLVVVGGLMGTGKSTFASKLAEELGLDVLATDAIRRQLFARDGLALRYGAGLYRPENRARVYQELFQMAANQLAQGLSVVLDGTFLSLDTKRRALDLASNYGAVAAYLRCVCPDETAIARIARRQQLGESVSDARPDLLEYQRREEESDPEHSPKLDVDTTQPLEDQVLQSCHFLARVSQATVTA